MLFSTGPKDSLEELFDREREVEKLKESVNKARFPSPPQS
jgi:hypothetical protein